MAYTWVHSNYPRTISWNFGEKMFRIGGFEKIDFFETTKFQYSKFEKNVFFLSFLFKCLKNSWVAWIGFNFYAYSDFQQNTRGNSFLLHTVCTAWLISVWTHYVKKCWFDEDPSWKGFGCSFVCPYPCLIHYILF